MMFQKTLEITKMFFLVHKVIIQEKYIISTIIVKGTISINKKNDF